MKKPLYRAVMLLLAFMLAIPFNLAIRQGAKASAQGMRNADIVFVIDTTGSMGGVIANVRNNISQFVDILANNNINARLGLVTFKDIYADGTGSTVNHGWYANSNDFKNRLNYVDASGGGDGPESAVDGLEEARRMSYQTLSKKFIILVTDVEYKEGTRYDYPTPIYMSNEISYLDRDNIVTSVVAPTYVQGVYQNLYQTTGGIFTDINTAFSTNLTSLTNMINTNAVPSLTINAPSANQMFGQAGVNLVPRITVSDPDGDALVGKYYVDSETTARDTRTITNTTTAQQVSFNAVSLAGLSDGNHTLKVEISDQWADPVVRTVNFRVDQSAPVIGSMTPTPTVNSITVQATATDTGSGLASLPYRYSIGATSSAWTTSAHTFQSLIPNTSYDIKVEAKDQLEHIATRMFTSVYTLAQTPAYTVSAVSDTSLRINFTDSNPSGTQYQIKVGSLYASASGALMPTATFVTPVSKQFTVTGLTANSTYSVQALAQNQANVQTSMSSAVTGTTIAAAPVGISATKTQTTVNVSWPATTGATGYDIEVDGMSVNNGTTTSYTHSGLSPETRHTYRVRVKNAGGISNWSQETVVFTWPNPPATPNNLSAISKQTEVTLSWDGVAKAESYELEADGSVITLGNQTSYKHTGLEADTKHTYRIRALNIGGTSAWSNPLIHSTLPNPPEVPTRLIADLSIHSVNVSWSETLRATAYEIEVDGVITDNGASTTYLHEGLDALSGHTYRVRATNIGGKSAWSEPLDVTTHPEKPLAPANIMGTSEETVVTLTWYRIPHAELYEIEADGVVIGNTPDTQFLHIGLLPDTLHNYRIRAKNISGYSAWSAPMKMMTLPLPPEGDDGGGSSTDSLTNVTAIVTNDKIVLSWDTVAPDAKYDIEVDGVVQSNGADTIFNHTGLRENEFHTYKVRLRNDDQPGRWVAILSLSTLPSPPDAPKQLNASATDNSIELRWDRVDGATGYEIEIDGKVFTLDEATAYLHSGLAPGTSHTYRLRASNITGVTAWSPALTTSTANPNYEVEAELGATFDFTLFANNVQDFGETTFVVTYDAEALEVYDLYDFTPARETTASGPIAGSPLTVEVTPGRIAIQVNRNVVPGTSWSGEITTIKFKTKKGGQTAVKVTTE